MTDELDQLRPDQRALLDRWVPGARVVKDHSWGLVDTVVLELDGDQGRLILKAAGPSNGHIARELRAHREWLQPWTTTGHAPTLLNSDAAAKILLTRYLPGHLVEGTSAQEDPDTYRQAGALLARYHGQLSTYDDDWHDKLRGRAERYLEQRHRIAPEIEQQVRTELAGWPNGGAQVVPTHGDWQPRNWLIDAGVVRVIDLGRADLRPATTDFVRLARQDFLRDPRLERAFWDGYGDDPREPEMWRRELLNEAVATAVWAHTVGDEAFEQQGHTMLRSLYPTTGASS